MSKQSETAWVIVQGPEAMPSYLAAGTWSLDPARSLRFASRDAADVYAHGFLPDPSGCRYEQRTFE